MAEEETDLRVTQADLPDDFLDLEELCAFCAQKLTPRRRIIKNIFNIKIKSISLF